MILIRKWLLILLGLGLGVLTVMAQQRVVRHVVQKGETLYRLSRLYSVTVEDIVRLNPELSRDGLKADMEILVPVVKSTPSEPVSGCREMHKVKKKETLWSISQMYGITVEELKTANPAMRQSDYKLKKGELVCIPYPAENKAQEPVSVGYDKLKMAVVLPLVSDTHEAERAVEFYRGLLMAVEKMKSNGKDIYLYVYDESTYDTRMPYLLERIRQQDVQLLIGPLYPRHFNEFADFSVRENIKWMVPFSSKVGTVDTLQNLFLMNAPDCYKSEFSAELFVQTFKNVKVVFLHSANGNELLFSAGLRNLLVGKGYEVGDLLENYTLDQMRQALSPDKRTIFVPDASTRAIAQNIVENLKKLRSLMPNSRCALLGYPEWQTFLEDVRNSFYEADTYLFSNYFYNPYSVETRTFEAEYKANFTSLPINVYPRMSLLGYDTGMFWMNGLLKYGKDFSTQDVKTRSLQSDIRFVRVAESGGYVNNCMQFIHYRPDRMIEKISAR